MQNFSSENFYFQVESPNFAFLLHIWIEAVDVKFEDFLVEFVFSCRRNPKISKT